MVMIVLLIKLVLMVLLVILVLIYKEAVTVVIDGIRGPKTNIFC